jgi:hypothetical protein
MSSPSRFPQVALRLFGSNIIRRVKTGEVLSNNLICGVLFDFLCARIPGHDVTSRIEHIDGVFFDAIH